VKYKELPYDECYWEFESDVSTFQPEIERFNRIQSRSHKPSKQKSSLQDAIDSKKKSKEFQQYEHSPEFLSGGTSFHLMFFYFLENLACLFILYLLGLIIVNSQVLLFL